MPKPPKASVAPPEDASPPGRKAAPGAAAAGRKSARSTSARGAASRSTKAAKATPRASSSGRASSKSGQAKGASRPTAKGGDTTTDRFLDEQRTLLLAEREASLRQAEALRAEAAQLAEEMEPGDTQFDEESGEGGTLNVERERDLALSAQALSAVDDVDRALAKLDAGTYGTCEQCGQPIPKARLKALPSATLCVACKSGGLSRR